jgi:hypothetical protein
MLSPSLLLLLAAAAVGASGARGGPLRVRATGAVAPCVEAAARAYESRSGRVVVEVGRLSDPTSADVLVGAAAEVTRALEGGHAAAGSDAEVARVPWVLVVPPGNPQELRGLGDVGRARVDVWVAGGPAAHEARRVLQQLAPESLREAPDGAVPAGAAASLAPLCLARSGDRLPVDVPELVVEAAVSVHARRPDAAREFMSFLASAPGRRAFAAEPPRKK